ncbi:MAG: SMC-Scp complex subunit ScpB [Phycisphaeraceae bacterium]|nr:SMC-Scp complex subunit ScpB [Phycisphaeraceae bacterium]
MVIHIAAHPRRRRPTPGTIASAGQRSACTGEDARHVARAAAIETAMPKQASQPQSFESEVAVGAAPESPGEASSAPSSAAASDSNASTATLDPEPAIDPERIAELAPKIEALLITSGRPLTPTRLAQALGLAPLPESAVRPGAELDADGQPVPIVIPKRRRKRGPSGPTPEALIAACVASLNETYDQTSRSFRIETVAGGYRLMTLASFRPVIEALHGVSAQTRLSRAAIESLAIIAYRQPITRHQLEAIRGVSCGEVLSSLLERRLVEIAGRAEELGRPLLYATSRQFLGAFGLSSLKDLPSPQELGIARANAESPASATAPVATSTQSESASNAENLAAEASVSPPESSDA